MRAVVRPWYGRQVDEVFEVGGGIEKPVEHKVLRTTMIMMTMVLMMVMTCWCSGNVPYVVTRPELIMTLPFCVGLIMNLCRVGGDIARNICLVSHAQTVEMWRGGADWSD